MTTTQAIASKIVAATAKPGLVAVDPLTILALVQVLVQILQGCYAKPEDALAYLRCDDLRGRPVLIQIRRWKIRRLIAGKISAQKIRGERHADVHAAVSEQIEALTVDQIADLYADNK